MVVWLALTAYQTLTNFTSRLSVWSRMDWFIPSKEMRSLTSWEERERGKYEEETEKERKREMKHPLIWNGKEKGVRK